MSELKLGTNEMGKPDNEIIYVTFSESSGLVELKFET